MKLQCFAKVIDFCPPNCITLIFSVACCSQVFLKADYFQLLYREKDTVTQIHFPTNAVYNILVTYTELLFTFFKFISHILKLMTTPQQYMCTYIYIAAQLVITKS